MDQINVRRWASSLRQFHRSDFQPTIVTDVGVACTNAIRNASKIRECQSSNNNHYLFNEKIQLMSEEPNRITKSQFYTFDLLTKTDENLQSLSTTQHFENHPSDHHELDCVSDAGTYIIDDDDSEQRIHSSSSSTFKRYVDPAKARHGTFDIHGLISSAAHTIHRPIVDSNLQKKDLSLSSSNSSLLSFNEEEEDKPSVPIPPPIQNQIKPPESFVIPSAFETKSFPITHIPRRIVEAQLKSKPLPSKEPNLESNQNPSTEKYSFQLKSSIRPHTALNDQTTSFQRQTASAYSHYPRQRSSLSTIDTDKTAPKTSFLVRQQRSHGTSLKSAPNNQTNRAVELRRARAQAKIEELAQRTKKQFYKPHQHLDVMSASWHSHASSNNKFNLRTTVKTKPGTQKEDLSTTRTISSSLYQRSLTNSPIPVDNASNYSNEGERCDLLRDSGQRLAIKSIQLSSGILEKLKPNDIISVQELEQLVSKLQTVNRTLTFIDAVLTGSTHDDAFV